MSIIQILKNEQKLEWQSRRKVRAMNEVSLGESIKSDLTEGRGLMLEVVE